MQVAEFSFANVSVVTVLCSFSHFSDIVDHFFPPVDYTSTEKNSEKSEFAPFNYWKSALPEVVDEITEIVLAIKNK